MYRLAICDDEACCVEENRKMAANILQEMSVEFEIECFSTTEQLYEVLEKSPQRYQLLLLDIKFSNQNGMELARLLREKQLQTDLIFITGYDSYALEGYDVRALHYLLKPVDIQKMKKAIQSAYARQYKLHPLVVQHNGQTLSVPFGDILYIESFYRRIILHLANQQQISISGTLATILEKLPKQHFAQCHKSYCVNLATVKRVQRYQVLLEGGQTVPISKSQFEQFKTAFCQY